MVVMATMMVMMIMMRYSTEQNDVQNNKGVIYRPIFIVSLPIAYNR